MSILFLFFIKLELGGGMKAICVRQPWASLIAAGKKTIETRTWQAKFRGELLIVASLQPDKHALRIFKGDLQLPLGQAVAVVRVVDCRLMTCKDEAAACCDVYEGAWAWILEDIRAIQPFPLKGRLGIFEVSGHQRIYCPTNPICR